MILLKKDMAFSIKVKGIKYFLKDEDDEVIFNVAETSILCSNLLKRIGLDAKMIGYYIYDGKPIALRDNIKKGGTLQIVPFLSGG